jgi:FtsP/CotA-like multicopper oxidase with cupredoxin domain
MRSARFHAGILFLVCILVVLSAPSIRAQAAKSPPIRLYVREVSLKILGKEVKVMAITQESGAQGFNPQTSQGFDVEVVNQLKEPTSIHWHGLVVPALMDGVPFVSQEPIPPNGKFHYQFPLRQSGTYWMHSHFGLQEQSLGTAPLILQTKEQQAKAISGMVLAVRHRRFLVEFVAIRKQRGKAILGKKIPRFKAADL